MLLRFSKMHGLGNDFMVIDLITQRVYLNNEQIKRLADRHFGVGFDQLLLVEPPRSPDMDFRYRIFNADGSEVENCGNGARCFARFVLDRRLTTKRRINVETAGGPLTLTIEADERVVVDMGQPILEAAKVPFIALSEEPQTAPVHSIPLDEQLHEDGKIVATGISSIQVSTDHTVSNSIQVGVVSMGNPHAVLRVDNVETAPVDSLGPLMESHPRFPNRVNVGFMQVVDRQHIRLRVFERGVGETLACGTGACAAVVSGIQRGLLDNEVNVDLPGGRLTILWQGEGHHVMMIGPATKVFEGRLEL